MKKVLVLFLMVAVLSCVGCTDRTEPFATQTVPSTQLDETTGSSTLGIRYVDGELVVDWITDALEVERENEPFDFSAWLNIEADFISNQHKALYGRTVVTTTDDEELQKAVQAIDISYPLNDDEQIKAYVYALEDVLHQCGYMEDGLTPQVQEYEFGPLTAVCYTDGVMAIYFNILPPLGPYVRDSTGPTVFVSMESGEVLFIAYAL